MKDIGQFNKVAIGDRHPSEIRTANIEIRRYIHKALNVVRVGMTGENVVDA